MTGDRQSSDRADPRREALPLIDQSEIDRLTEAFVPEVCRRAGTGPETAFVTGRFDPGRYRPGLYERMSVERPPRFDRMAPRRQADFLAGRFFARLALSELGRVPGDIPIGPDGAPGWPDGTTGSLSHSHGLCCCILTTDCSRACGVDTEVIATGAALDAIRQSCLTAADRTWLGQQTCLPQATLATLLFSAKETVYKAFSFRVGGYFGFECAEVVGWDGCGVLRMRLTRTLHDTLPAGSTLPVSAEIVQDRVLTWMMEAV